MCIDTGNTENSLKDANELENADSGEMVKKGIYNSKTRTYYALRQRTTKKGKKGQITGKWKGEDS